MQSKYDKIRKKAMQNAKSAEEYINRLPSYTLAHQSNAPVSLERQSQDNKEFGLALYLEAADLLLGIPNISCTEEDKANLDDYLVKISSMYSQKGLHNFSGFIYHASRNQQEEDIQHESTYNARLF